MEDSKHEWHRLQDAMSSGIETMQDAINECRQPGIEDVDIFRLDMIERLLGDLDENLSHMKEDRA